MVDSLIYRLHHEINYITKIDHENDDGEHVQTGRSGGAR